jgi:hypothetical protein
MTQALNLGLLGNNVNTSGQVSLTAGVAGTLPVANGGIGTTTLTANNVLLGNGGSAPQVVAPGTSGNALVSNGTSWVSGSVEKLSTATGIAPSYSARAWVNFNGTGTVAIRASGNVSSITDNGTGDYTVNFTTAMSDANYALASGMFDTNGTGNVYMTPQTYSTKQTASVKVFSSELRGSNNTVVRIDQANMDVAIFR